MKRAIELWFSPVERRNIRTSFPQNCIRQNRFKINHFYKPLQKMHENKIVCHSDEISVWIRGLDRETSDL